MLVLIKRRNIFCIQTLPLMLPLMLPLTKLAVHLGMLLLALSLGEDRLETKVCAWPRHVVVKLTTTGLSCVYRGRLASVVRRTGCPPTNKSVMTKCRACVQGCGDVSIFVWVHDWNEVVSSPSVEVVSVSHVPDVLEGDLFLAHGDCRLDGAALEERWRMLSLLSMTRTLANDRLLPREGSARNISHSLRAVRMSIFLRVGI